MKRTLLVSAPRTSGSGLTHAAHLVPRLMRLLPDWAIEVHGCPDVLRTCFGEDNAPWKRPFREQGHRGRLRWEMVDLPRRLLAEPDAMVLAPFGPPMNVALLRRTVWVSQNVLPSLPAAELEISPADRPRVRALRVLYGLWARFALRTICVSRYGRGLLTRLARVPAESFPVVPHGVDPPAQGLRCTSEELERVRSGPYVLHVGQPVPYRRTRELFEGFARLAARRTDAPPLVVAGKARGADRPYEDACAALLAPLVAAGRAKLLGQVPHGDVIALTASASAIAAPSVHDDCPNPVLEALSARRVGVYADIPPAREVAADAGIFVPDPRPASLAEALERSLFDEAERARIAHEAPRRAAMFTWDRSAESTAAVLESCVR